LIGYRRLNKEGLDTYSNVMLRAFPDEGRYHLLYGFNEDLFNSLPKEDRDKIENILESIYDNLLDIDLIKYNHLTMNVIPKEMSKISFQLKELLSDYPSFHGFINGVCSLFSIFAFAGSFEMFPRHEDTEAKGFPFDDFDFDSKRDIFELMRLQVEFHHNIVHHRKELFDYYGIPEKIGNIVFDILRELSIRIKEKYDVHSVSYCLLSSGVFNKRIYDVIDSKLISKNR
jgi:hypothetical protein